MGSTDYMKLNLACRMGVRLRMWRSMLPCSRHPSLSVVTSRRVASKRRLFVPSEICKWTLTARRSYTTIRQAVEVGKQMPIRELLDNEQDAKREMLIKTGYVVHPQMKTSDGLMTTQW